MNDKTKLSAAAKFAKWSIRKSPGNSPKGMKVASGISLAVGVIYLVMAFNDETLESLSFAFLWIAISLTHFIKAGFCELIEKGYTQ